MRHLVVAAALAVAGIHPALAHEGGHHVKGVIKEVSAQRLVVTDQAGNDVTFAITDGTEFFRQKKAVKREDAKTGERVAVHGEMAGAAVNATEVMLAGAPGPAKAK